MSLTTDLNWAEMDDDDYESMARNVGIAPFEVRAPRPVRRSPRRVRRLLRATTFLTFIRM